MKLSDAIEKGYVESGFRHTRHRLFSRKLAEDEVVRLGGSPFMNDVECAPDVADSACALGFAYYGGPDEATGACALGLIYLGTFGREPAPVDELDRLKAVYPVLSEWVYIGLLPHPKVRLDEALMTLNDGRGWSVRQILDWLRGRGW